MKRYTVLLALALLLCLCCYNSFGQYSSMHTPYGKVNIPNPSTGTTFLPFLKSGSGSPKMKALDYTVVLNSGEIYKGTGKLRLYKGKYYIQFYKGKKLRLFNPEDTKSITAITEMGRKMVGLPAFNDSCWLFKTYEGKINKYSVAPEWGTPYPAAIQKDPQMPPVEISKENVMNFVQDNPEALEKVKKGKLLDAVRIYNRP
ncbi:hypothetical protein SAMN05192529_1125 [Arachidicoccus rhizosphaerae]|uniref:Uncharacterized protein n=1 Tax=Arachidicoccus rhizosphaerae TaxID=551991 RepID=A0A1H3ZRT6_9BACT|nr:hypothetical protein [Arachidicoccus rhizosphaerae]SEA26476.1 hypothetical protein SAMN05192529_1125 [Arachidicoccus rhizosphaerae]